jgi:AraC-like DNA-binding protein
VPLFIDYHQLEEGLTIEDVRKAHQSDLVNQEKHRVKYLQFWVNEKNSMVFCLIEGPDAESCINCHLESHGNTPCNIQEVEPGIFELIMGAGLAIDDHHMTLNKNGKPDPAYRIVLVAQYPDSDTLDREKQLNQDAKDQLKIILVRNVNRALGRFIEFSIDGDIVAVFDEPGNAFQFIKNIDSGISSTTLKYNWRVGKFALYYGLPLTDKGSFFKEAINHAKILCRVAESGQVVVAAGLKNLVDIKFNTAEFAKTSIRILNRTDEKIIIELFQTIEQNLASEQFNVNYLARLLGTSRTQLYRKATRLTGKTPNELIRGIRMRKALNLIQNNVENIARVSLEVGYSNPSYFSRIFRETYGCTPSHAHSRKEK